MKKNNLSINIAMISTLLSILLHIYLTKHFFDVRFVGVAGPSFCNINDYFNCDAVAASPFSSLWGVPVSLWGVVTNLALLFTLIPIKWLNPSPDHFSTAYAKALSALILVGSVIMGSISFFVMDHACLVCIGTYILSILTALTLFAGLSSSLKDLFHPPRFYIFLTSTLVWGPFFLNFLISQTTGLDKIEPLIKESLYYWKTNPEYSFRTDLGLVFQNSTESNPAIMTIVEFADYGCPHCKVAAPTLHAFTQQHHDVRLIFKPFPLDGVCNPALSSHKGNGIRCLLAKITLCMEKLHQSGWKTHDQIFADQEAYMNLATTTEALDFFIGKSSVEKTSLENCTADPIMDQMITDSANEGEMAKIEGTPSIFVNGRKLDRGHFSPILESTYQSIRSQYSK